MLFLIMGIYRGYELYVANSSLVATDRYSLTFSRTNQNSYNLNLFKTEYPMLQVSKIMFLNVERNLENPYGQSRH